MNVYLIGLNLSPEEYMYACREADKIPAIYPSLCKNEKFFFTEKSHGNYLHMLYSAKEYRGSRKYIAQNDDYILFYSGLPIDPSGKIKAHNADELLVHFEELKYELEGIASIVRVRKSTFDVEIITGCLAMEQVYYFNFGSRLVISNMVRSIQNITGNFRIDPLAVSYYLSLGWAASDKTLAEEIKVIKGGEHWKWNSYKKVIDKKTYFDPTTIKPEKEDPGYNIIKKLCTGFGNELQILSNSFKLECPLTGGFDSRLIAALLINNSIDADYYTNGNPKHKEITIASIITKKFNLPYTIYPIDNNLIEENWNKLVRTFILQNDGLVSLWQLVDILTHSDIEENIHVRLGTAGSEIARMAYNQPHLLLNNTDETDIFVFMRDRLLYNYEEILTSLTLENYTNFLSDFFKENMGKGVYFKYLPDFFFALERVGKHKANNLRKIRYIADSFSIYCTKDYIVQALKLHPINKFSFPIHYKAIKMLNKELHKIPFLYGKWPVQNIKIKFFLDEKKKRIKKYLKDRADKIYE